MDRRDFVAGLLLIPTALSHPVEASRANMDARGNDREPHDPLTVAQTPNHPLVSHGPVTSQADDQIIENLDITAMSGSAITVQHRGVTVRHCRIRHAGGHGILATGAPGLTLRELEIDHVGAANHGPGPAPERDNIHLDECPTATVTGIKASRGSANIYAHACGGLHVKRVELHDARGPTPRGQNVQFDHSPFSVLEEFSAENGPSSWTEDNISIFASDRCIVRRGLVAYNNSPTGDGVMLEGSLDCIVADVDAIHQGNGAFAAVPQGSLPSGGCSFVRCRTRDSYNGPRDGRAAPSSNGLAIYTRISPSASRHRIIGCHYASLANPHNLVWKLTAVQPGWSFTELDFTPRPPLRLDFQWRTDRS